MLWQQPGHSQRLEKQLALWSDLSIMNVCPCSLPVNWQVDSAKSAWLLVTGIDSQTAQISRSSLQTPLIGLPKLLQKMWKTSSTSAACQSCPFDLSAPLFFLPSGCSHSAQLANYSKSPLGRLKFSLSTCRPLPADLSRDFSLEPSLNMLEATKNSAIDPGVASKSLMLLQIN